VLQIVASVKTSFGCINDCCVNKKSVNSCTLVVQGSICLVEATNGATVDLEDTPQPPPLGTRFPSVGQL
jgi:hypothetical protein